MNISAQAIQFIEQSSSLDTRAKINAALFFLGEKKAVYVSFSAMSKKERESFERVLHGTRILFKKSIRRNGKSVGYDLFLNKKIRDEFERAIHLLKNGDEDKSDALFGKLYDFPPCCVRAFIQQKHRGFTSVQAEQAYVVRARKILDTYSFVVHTPCSLRCKETKRMNARNSEVLKRNIALFQ